MGMNWGHGLGNTLIDSVLSDARAAGFERKYSLAIPACLITYEPANYTPGFIGRRAKYTESPFAPSWAVTIARETYYRVAKGGTLKKQQASRVSAHINSLAVRRVARYFHLPVSSDLGGIFLSHGKEKYHVQDLVALLAAKTREEKRAEARQIERTAIGAFRKRKTEKINVGRINNFRGYVSIDDSVKSGNCVSMTEDFAREMYDKISAKGPCAVRADIILSERNDNYTRRAVMQAWTRTNAEVISE